MRPRSGDLVLCGAGAGSGKTTSICNHVVDRIVAGLDPARLLATTFTIRAAAELKARIHATLLTDPRIAATKRWALAERLERATVGTVHAVAFQLLRRYAIHLGLSPELRVAGEEAAPRLLRQALEQIEAEPWEELAEVARRLGGSSKEVERLLLDLLEAMRANLIGPEALREQLAASLAETLAMIAPEGPRVDLPGLSHLQALAVRAFDDLQSIADDTKVTRNAQTTLRELASGGRGQWADFLRAAKLNASKTSGADRCLGALRAYGQTVRAQPGLHADLTRFIECLAEQTIALEERYQRFKDERGLLDFTDLERQLLRLLRDPDPAASLAADFELVVVDEFQDTSPLQLAIFVRLRELIPANYWVGDAKQAIYGFRGTDARLMRAVWERAPDARHTQLDSNWRSQQGLVQLIGELFEPAFGSQAHLTPRRPAQELGIERWVLEATSAEEDAERVVQGIAQLIEEGVEPRVIAVLARQNAHAERLGRALTTAGIPVVLELSGLIGHRECRAALAALALVLDRYDALAAVQLMTLLEGTPQNTPAWLEERLRAQRTGSRDPPWPTHPLLVAIDGVRTRAGHLSPAQTIAAVIAALRLAERAATWGDPGARGSHLDTLVELSRRYEHEARDAERPATLAGLVDHLQELADLGEDRHVAPHGLDAVTVLTYHGAKGLEWGVVVLTELNHEPRSELDRPRVSGGDPGAADPLRGRVVRFHPSPFGVDRMGRRRRDPTLADDQLASAAGREAAEEAEAEALRLLYVGMTRARDRLVLAHRPEKGCAWLDRLPGAARRLPFDVRVPAATTLPLPGSSTGYRLRRLRGRGLGLGPRPAGPAPRTAWLARPLALTHPPAPAIRNPSAEEDRANEVEAFVHRLAGGPESDPVHPYLDDDGGRRGRGVHAYLAALPSLRGCALDAHRRVARACLAAHAPPAPLGGDPSVPGEGQPSGEPDPEALDADELAATGMRFVAWVEARYPDATWHTETPITGPVVDGGQWVGVIDLLLELPGSRRSLQVDHPCVLVDHKSARLPHAAWARYARSHAAQLLAYRDLVMATGRPAPELWIHLPLCGAMVELRPQGLHQCASLTQAELFGEDPLTLPSPRKGEG